jgi:hypothetical protein
MKFQALSLLLLTCLSAAAVDIRVETTQDFATYQVIRNDTLAITEGFVRMQIVGFELVVQQSTDGVSWADTRVRIPIARAVNKQEFFRLTVL